MFNGDVMTKIGVRFEISQSFDTNCLFEILKCIKEENLNWHIIDNQTEVWADSEGTEAFSKNEYDNEEFFNLISYNHYAVFAKIQAYQPSYNFYELHTTEEFKNSDCKILILICDSFWCDIYINESSMLEKIYENMIQYRFENVTYIYDSNDERTKLDVL